MTSPSVWFILMPQGYTIFCLLNKTLTCNQAVTLVTDRTVEITHSFDISICLPTYCTYLYINIYLFIYLSTIYLSTYVCFSHLT